MATRLATAAAVALALVCPARGDTRISVRHEREPVPALSVGTPTNATLDRARVAIDRTGRARLSLVLSTRAKVAHAGSITIDLPRGSRAHAMTEKIGLVRSNGFAFEASEARTMFTNVVERKYDPALLEHVATSAGTDRLALRVFPLVKGTPAEIEIDIELPAIERVAVAAPIEIDGNRVVELDRRTWMTEDTAERSHVSESTSLYAGAAVSPVPIVTIGCTGYRHDYGPDKRSIRSVVKLQIPRLRHCYMRQAQLDPTLAGTAVLHFTIDRHGRTSEINIDGTLANDAVHACLIDEVVTWTFGKSDSGATRVSYPLTFQLSGR